jgi:iron complex outermembrane recepter protein
LKTNQKLTYAITAVLSAYAGVTFAAATADTGGIEEVVVTAQRRSENMQAVPITMQALTSETLKELHVSTIEEFVKYLPSVSTASMGPGQSNIYMRGLSLGAYGTQGVGSVGQWPNVAVYLDDQSTQIPGRNLDVYAADLERIEVLEGPQGTLFGAGAEAGTLRYITNKPKQGVTEASTTGGYSTTAHGAPSSNIEAMLNLPLSDDMAIRAVVYSDSRGGYIDNVPGTFTRKSTDVGFQLRTGGRVPTDSVVINNDNIAANDINPVSYKGLRVSLAYKISDDWNMLLTQSYQDMHANGVFYQMPLSSDGPSLNPLEVTVFNDNITTDKFTNTALTVNGKVGSLDLVYTGAYLVRDSFQIQDYTNYARGVWGTYYQCTGYSGSSVDKCYSPSSIWRDNTHNVNQSHEFRLSTPKDWAVSGIVGVFYEKRELTDTNQWQYKTVPECVVGGPASCFLALDPSQAPKFDGASMSHFYQFGQNVGFVDDFKRSYDQSALFGSVDWHATDKLTLTAGTRYFDIKNQMLGGNIGSFFCKLYGGGTLASLPNGSVCNGASAGYNDFKSPYGTNLDAQATNHSKSSGFKSRLNISYKLDEQTLLYATWSQGYRPGGFNRGANCVLDAVSPTTNKYNPQHQYCVPQSYESDSLINKEIGWKTTLLGNHLQINGALYQEDWKNVQSGIFAPQLGFGNLTVAVNGPSYRVKGAELSIIARVTQGLTIQGSGSYNKSELVNSPVLRNNCVGVDNQCGGTLGEIITNSYVSPLVPNVAVVGIFGNQGDPLANSPKLQANVRARYEWTVGKNDLYWQIGAAHQGESFSSATVAFRNTMPAWTQYDASAGVAQGPWTIELVAANLTDINKSIYTSSTEFIQTQVPQRPRTLGIRFGYKLGAQ